MKPTMRALLAPMAVLAGSLFSLPQAQSDELPAAWRLVQRAVEKGGVQEEFDVVLEHMRGIEKARANVGNKLSCVMRGLAEPWAPPAQSAALKELLGGPAAGKNASFDGLNEGIAKWLDIEGFEPCSPDAEHPGLQELGALFEQIAAGGAEGQDLVESLSEYMGLAHSVLEEALGELEDDEGLLLFDGYADFYEAWYRTHFPSGDVSPEQKRSISAFKNLMKKPIANRALVLGVADSLLKLSDSEFERSLLRRLVKLKPLAAGGDLVARAGDAPSNRVLVSGKRSSTHTEPAALIIDLGGNDLYRRAAVVDSPDMLVSMVLDLGGDDTYEADGHGQAFAAGGVALLIDRKGNDVYQAGRLGQGASVLGFAALIDQAGDDRYTAEDYSQGHALCGIGLLYDMQGKDEYKAWAFAQGGGIGYGLCALVDGAGDDQYLADLAWPDVYGNSGPDVYHGASQGYSTGMRPEIAGGIASLIDLGDGDDRYQSGSFAQGGGYYFSFGLMYDDGGDDQNFGSRYSQGFGVHQGIGVRWDAAGNDAYTCRSVAHAGMAWDEGVGYLLEDGGDDTYKTGDLSCGGAAQTAIAIHIDLGGKDTYQTGRESQGGTGSSEYHNKPALGILIDLGGKKDSYSAAGREDQSLRTSKGVEIFADLKSKDLTRALKSKLLRP